MLLFSAFTAAGQSGFDGGYSYGGGVDLANNTPVHSGEIGVRSAVFVFGYPG